MITLTLLLASRAVCAVTVAVDCVCLCVHVRPCMQCLKGNVQQGAVQKPVLKMSVISRANKA